MRFTDRVGAISVGVMPAIAVPLLLVIGLAPIDHGSFLTVMVDPLCLPWRKPLRHHEHRRDVLSRLHTARWGAAGSPRSARRDRLPARGSAVGSSARTCPLNARSRCSRSPPPSWQSRRSRSAFSNDAARCRAAACVGRIHVRQDLREHRTEQVLELLRTNAVEQPCAHHVLNAIDLAHAPVSRQR